MPGISQAWAIYLFCGALVTISAWKRYNTPHTNSASTTRLRYRVAGGLYILCTLFLYIGLSQLLQAQGFAKFIGAGAASGLPDVPSPPMVAALVMTTLLPNVPMAKEIDQALLRLFLSVGRIPAEALRLAGQLRPDRFEVRRGDVEDLRGFIHNQKGIPDGLAAEVRSGPEESARLKFTRTALLYMKIDGLRSSPDYAHFFGKFGPEWKEAQEKFSSFVEQSSAFFASFKRIGTVAADETELLEARDRYRRSCLSLFEHLSGFLSYALLSSERNARGVAARLGELGFDTDRIAAPQNPWNLLAKTFVLVFAFFVLAGVASVHLGFLPRDGQLAIISFIALAQTLGVAAALTPKIYLGHARTEARGERPYWAYMGSSAVAFVSVFLVGFVLNGALPPGWAEVFAAQRVVRNAMLAAVLAFAVSYACDDWPGQAEEPRWLRPAEAIGCGFAMAAAIFALAALVPPTAAAPRPPAPVYVPLLIAFGVGCICGALVPHAYRAGARMLPAPPSRQPIGAAVALRPIGIGQPSFGGFGAAPTPDG